MNQKHPKAFTLIELLTVLLIISLLSTIVMPSLKRARGSARQTVCMTNLRSSGMAAMLYAQDLHFLPGSAHWFISIAPYLNQPVPDNYFSMTRQTMPTVLFCPDDRMPYPKPYMGGLIEAASWFVNGAETDFAMGHGLKIGFGLFGGRGRLSRIRTASACMLMGETANYAQIADAEHPSVQQALRAANASVSAAKSRFHHRATSRFSHFGKMNIFYADGRVAPLSGVPAEPWPLNFWPAGALMEDGKPFYPTLSLPTAVQSPHFWGPYYQSHASVQETF